MFAQQPKRGSFETTGVESAAPRCSRGSTCTLAPPVALRHLGVGASCESAAGDWLGACLWVSTPQRPFLPNLPGRSSTATPSPSPIMRAAALAALSSPRPVLAACRTHPCPVPSSLVSAPETLALPVSFGAWGTDCPRPPSMHHRHPPEYRDTPACPRSGYCWAAPQRQLNLHTRTWRTITDFDPGCSSALRRVAEAPITISGSLFMTLCEPLDMSFGKTGTAKQRCCMLCLECASVWTQQLLLRAVSGRVQSRPAPQSSLAHFRIFLAWRAGAEVGSLLFLFG